MFRLEKIPCPGLIAVMLLLPPAAGAGVNRWTPIGPPGGMVTAVAFDAKVPVLSYATTSSAGLFRSTDSGTTWRASNAGLADVHLYALAAGDGALYVGGALGLARSDDRGLHFRSLPFPIPSAGVTAIAVSRSVLLVAANACCAWRSEDGGQTWADAGEGLQQDYISALLFHPRRRSIIFAAGNGVYRSFDGGAHWNRASNGLIDPFNPSLFTSLALDSRNVLYAGRSSVGHNLAEPLPSVFVSLDLGDHWQPATRQPDARGVLSLLADNTGAVWAGTEDGGVFRTTDSGDTWEPVRAGIEGQAISALALAPRQRAPRLLAGSGTPYLPIEGPGVFRMSSAGRWLPSTSGPTATAVLSLAADALTPGVIFASDPYRSIFRTLTAGASWRLVNRGLRLGAVVGTPQVIANPGEPHTLYATLPLAKPAFHFTVYRSTDQGVSWVKLTDPPAGCRGPLAVGGHGRLLVGGYYPAGCMSQDGGLTWVSSCCANTSAIAFAPSNPLRVYASAARFPQTSAFYRSDDGGLHWSASQQVLAQGLTVDPLDADVVYMAADSILRSRDAGATWETLIESAHAAAVRIDRRAPNAIYAITGTRGGSTNPVDSNPRVIVSDDGGETWRPLTAGLPPNVAVVDLAFDAADPALLYAATSGAGILALHRVR